MDRAASPSPPPPNEPDREPRWLAAAAVVAAGVLHFALPRSMRVGPPWLVLGVVTTLVVLSVLARSARRYTLNDFLGYATLAVLTGAMLYGIGVLVGALPRHAEPPAALLRSAAVLWATNVLVFASWYWRLDAGGPNERDRRRAHTRGAFLFPQMMLGAPGAAGDATVAEAEGWRPGFVDYLFVAFNTSTAFSPTDVPVLSRWAKLMTMVQSVISLATVVLLAARAVNIL